MESFTGITALDQFLIEYARITKSTVVEVTRIRDFPLFEELTNLEPDKSNSILKESAGGSEILLVYGYEIWSASDLTVRFKANVDTVITSDKLKLTFKEPYIIEPSKELEILESHATGTIPLKISVKAVSYLISCVNPGGAQ